MRKSYTAQFKAKVALGGDKRRAELVGAGLEV